MAALGCGGAAAQGTDGPLSAIDWLSRVTSAPPEPPPPADALPDALPDAPAEAEAITVTSLDGPNLDALGLLPADRTGLPRDLWGMTPAATLAEALAELGPDTLPALQGLLLTLLVAELEPPRDAAGRGALFSARLDRLVAFGALDAARALLETAGPDTDPDLFLRWFDLALLAGDTGAPCATLRARPGLAPDAAARIYCAARDGDWDAAEALLDGPEGAGLPVPKRRALARFLDPEAAYDTGPVPLLPRPSPLMWQIADALGEAGTATALPLAYAHADLAGTAGWKAQLEAAERLARAGVLTPNRLLGLYTRRVAAASGGVWDRVAAVQRLDAALVEGAAGRVADALPPAWEMMAEAELEVALAVLMAERLAGVDLGDAAAALAWRMGLLAGLAPPPPPPLPGQATRDGFLAAIAAGTVGATTRPPPGAMPAAIAEGLTADPDPGIAAMLAEGRRGEVLLRAMALLQGSGRDDPRVVAEALATLRAAGQDRVARQAALELLLLDRRG